MISNSLAYRLRLALLVPGMFLFVIIWSCQDNQQERSASAIQWESVKESDDYKEYLNYIMAYPESDHFKQALDSYFKGYNAHLDSLIIMDWHCRINCVQVLVNYRGQILFDNQLIKIDSLQHASYHFILNKDQWPELKDVTFKDKAFKVSDGYFKVRFNRDSCPNIQEVIVQIRQGLDRYKVYLAHTLFNTEIDALPEDEGRFLDSVLTGRIVLQDWAFMRSLWSPPPEINLDSLDD